MQVPRQPTYLRESAGYDYELQDATFMELPKATETPKPVVAAAFGSLLMAIGAAFAYFRGGSPKQAPSATDLDVALDWTENQRTLYPSGSGFGDIQMPFMGDSVWAFDDEEEYDLERGDLVVMYNRKKGIGCTKGGTKRRQVGVSGFRKRMSTAGGRKVLARRRAKGRHVLCHASERGSKHGPAR